MSGFVAQNTAVQAPSVVGAFGEALGQVSEVQHWAAQVPVQDSLNQLNASLMKIKTDAGQQLGANVRPDKDGKSFTDRHLVEFDKDMERVASNLKSGTQKTMFSQRAAILRQSLQGDLYAHETKEMKADAVNVNQSTVALMNEQAKTNLGNLQALTLNQVQIDSAVKDQALLLGWSPEEAQVQRQKAMDQFHGGVIGAAIDAGGLGYAKTYLENHANDMSADQIKKAQKILTGASVDSASVDLARSALDAARSAGLDRTKGYELIDKQAGNNKDLRDKALSEFDHSFGVYKEQKKALVDQDEASIYRMTMDRKAPAVIFKAIRALPNMDDTDKAKLTESVTKMYKGDAEDRTAAREAKKESQQAALLRYQLNPNAVWKMTPDQLINKLPELGSDGVSKLVTMKQAMEKRGPESFQIDADTFNDLATKAGFRPKSQGDAPKLLDAKSKIEAQIAQEQGANKQHPNQELAPERKKEIARYWLSDVITRDKGFLGGDIVKKSKRFQVENVSNIVAAIPPDHMGGIVSYLEEMSRRSNRKQAVSLADLTPDEIVALEQELFPKGQ